MSEDAGGQLIVSDTADGRQTVLCGSSMLLGRTSVPVVTPTPGNGTGDMHGGPDGVDVGTSQPAGTSPDVMLDIGDESAPAGISIRDEDGQQIFFLNGSTGQALTGARRVPVRSGEKGPLVIIDGETRAHRVLQRSRQQDARRRRAARRYRTSRGGLRRGLRRDRVRRAGLGVVGRRQRCAATPCVSPSPAPEPVRWSRRLSIESLAASRRPGRAEHTSVLPSTQDLGQDVLQGRI